MVRPSSDVLAIVSSEWKTRFTFTMGEELLRNGFTVVRQAFPPHFTAKLRHEMEFLHQTKQLYANSTHVHLHNTSTPILLEKKHIFEAELVQKEIRAQVPTLEWFYKTQLVSSVLYECLPSWLNLEGDTVKLQYNQGQGGCFPMHFDSYGDDGKCLTAVLYLNNGWKEGDGGEIVLYPFPRSPVVVQPKDGDLVLFSSQQMLHRVMPSYQPRHCLTTWIYHSRSDQIQERNAFYNPSTGVREGQQYKGLATILHSSFRRHLAKLYHAQEWTRSLQESHHHDRDGFKQYMTTHQQELQVIEAATTKMLTSMSQRGSPCPSSAQELFTWMERNTNQLDTLPIPWF